MYSEKHVCYRDFYAYLDRLRDMAHIRGQRPQSSVIAQTFRGSALILNLTKLPEMEKSLLHYTDLDGWVEGLINRFEGRTPVTLIKLSVQADARYDMAQQRRNQGSS